MKQWDIILIPFPVIGPHPAVVLSPDAWCADQRASTVNVLACTTLRAGAEPRASEVRLDQSDGLDWATIVRCNLIYQISKTQLGRYAGTVAIPRRRGIAKKLIECFQLQAH